MADITATIEKVTALEPVVNSDRLDVVTVGGFPVVVQRDSLEVGDYVAYFAPDIQFPRYVAEKLGLVQYLRKSTIVRAVKLRGQYSYGVALPLTGEGFDNLKQFVDGFIIAGEEPAGTNIDDYFGTRRFVPQPNFKGQVGQQASEHPLLFRYTDIDRFEKFQHVFQAGEPVVVTEKIHGTCSRVSTINGEIVVGSRKTQRATVDIEQRAGNIYWFPLTINGVDKLLYELGAVYQQVILFGEVFGKGIQGGFDYGQSGLAYRAFDLFIDGNFVDAQRFDNLMAKYEIPTVPVDYIGEFVPEYIQPYIDAGSKVTNRHMREGVVIKPLHERTDSRHGRVIAKWINPAYLVRKSEGLIEDNQE